MMANFDKYKDLNDLSARWARAEMEANTKALCEGLDLIKNSPYVLEDEGPPDRAHYGRYGEHCQNMGHLDAGRCTLCKIRRIMEENFATAAVALIHDLLEKDHSW